MFFFDYKLLLLSSNLYIIFTSSLLLFLLLKFKNFFIILLLLFLLFIYYCCHRSTFSIDCLFLLLFVFFGTSFGCIYCSYFVALYDFFFKSTIKLKIILFKLCSFLLRYKRQFSGHLSERFLPLFYVAFS